MEHQEMIPEQIPESSIPANEEKLDKEHHFNNYDPHEATRSEAEISADKKKNYYVVLSYDNEHTEIKKSAKLRNALVDYRHDNKIFWINVEGTKKSEIRRLCQHFNIHTLLIDDILSRGQRAKSDALDEHLFCILPILHFSEDNKTLEKEQLSIVLGKNYVLSFLSGNEENPFKNIRQKYVNQLDIVRSKSADFLCHNLMDTIVDDYFTVLENVSTRLHQLESLIIKGNDNKKILIDLSTLRNELMLIKTSITPVRDLIQSFMYIDSKLVENENVRFFKDIYDHILLAIEYCESYRELANNLQDLYMNQVNQKMNEVMKIFTFVTVLLAPATIIGGIFGMNFDSVPLLHNNYGFYVSIFLMIFIPIVMFFIFRKKGWF